MSSFLMGYPHHIQNPMHSAIDPKFPPSTDDYHHHHNHLHHNGYAHNSNSMSSTMPPIQSNNDYVNGVHHQNSITNGMHSSNTNNYNYSHTISGHFYQHSYNSQMHHVPAPPSQTTTNNSYSNSNNNAYYNNYYGSNNNQMMDLPLQYSNTEPTNTVLGLQELGVCMCIC